MENIFKVGNRYVSKGAFTKTYDEEFVSKQTKDDIEYLQVIHFVNSYQKAIMLEIPTKGEYNFYDYPKIAQISVYDETETLIEKEITLGFKTVEDRDKYFSYYRGSVKPEKISYTQLTE